MKTAVIRIISVVKKSALSRQISRTLGQSAQIVFETTMDNVLEHFERDFYDVLIISSAAFKSGQIDGIKLIEIIATKSPATQILFLAEASDVKTAISVLKAGSFQYAKIPISDEELGLLINTAIEQRPRYSPNLLLKKEMQRTRFQELVGQAAVMHEIYKQIRQAAATDIPVLITGETGTGKDLVAQAIHRSSTRRDGPYLPINLGALPKELVASELFGHEKGAFTGATEQRKGIFEQGHDGTVFLDEIGSVSGKVQISLLRLIEQKRFNRLGGRKSYPSNARLITASNENLRHAISKGSFREDLYYRLDVFHIVVPPLRERAGDVALLIGEFIKRYNISLKKNILGISPECISILENYKWPGNVRELKNAIQRAVLVSTGDVLLPEHLPSRLLPVAFAEKSVSFKIGTPLREIERDMIIRVLAVTDNNRKKTAEILGISRRALYNKLKKYCIK